jgi:hypothetical protein
MGRESTTSIGAAPATRPAWVEAPSSSPSPKWGADGGGQPQQPVDVQPVHPAQVHQHVGFDLAVHPPVVRQGDVAHHRAVGVGPLRESQVHDHDQIRRMQARQTMNIESCYYISGASPAIPAAREPVTCGIIATVTRVWLRTAEAGRTSDS